VTHHADSLVIETNLVPVGERAQPVTRTYPFQPAALLSIEQEIAADVAASLTPIDPHRPPGSLARRPASKSDSAYPLLFEAEYYLAKRTHAGILRARDLASDALELNPLYGDAYALLATAYQGFAWYGLEQPDRAFMKAETAARKGVALDTASGLAHAVVAAALSFYRYRWEDGEEEFRRAIALDPENAMIRNFYSIHLRSLGRFPEALAEIRRAQEMDQLYGHFFWNSGFILTLAGRDEEAIVEFRRALAIDSSFLRARLALSEALARRGLDDAALGELRAGFVIAGDTAAATAVAAARGKMGYSEVLRRLGAIDIQRLRRRIADGQYVGAFDLANALLDAGERESAIAEFERAFAVRDPRVTYLFLAPRYRDLMREPRIQALQRAMNLH
jgi:Tfp pilus assembly protein PilF